MQCLCGFGSSNGLGCSPGLGSLTGRVEAAIEIELRAMAIGFAPADVVATESAPG